jgi:hypothetical protein
MNTPTNKYLTLLLLPFAGYALWYFFQYLLQIEFRFTDAEIFVKAAYRYTHEDHLYKRPYMVAPMDASFKFPPLYALPYIVPALINFDEPRSVIYENLFWPLVFLHVFRYVLSLALIIAFFGQWKNTIWLLIASIIFFVSAPFDESLTGLEFSNLLLFVLILSFVLLKYGWQWIPAILLAYVSMAKLYPIVIIIFFIARKEWDFLLRFLSASIIWKMISLAYFGFSPFLNFHLKILPILLHEDIVISVMNRSLYSHFAIKDSLVDMYKMLFVALTMLIIFFANGKKSYDYRNTDAALMFGFTICTMLLVLENCWGQYQLILLFPILILIASAFDKNTFWASFRIVAAMLAWLPLTIGYVSIVFAPEEVAKINSLLFLRDFSPLVLWVTLAVLLLADIIRSTHSWQYLVTIRFPKVLAKE